MALVLVEAQIENYDHFREVFSTRGLAARQSHGSHHATLFRHLDDPHAVTILFEWESREAVQRFLDDPKVKETMKSSGTIGRPRFTFVELAQELPG